MNSVSLAEIVRAFRQVGLKPGDMVNVQSRLFAIGAVSGCEVSAIPDIYIRAFREVIGDEGTIVVPTYTTSFGRFGTSFVLEESPSEMGALSERVRLYPGAVRTLHPIQSLTALGGQAQALAKDHPRWNVGHDTIWERMLLRGCKVVGLGLPPRRSMTVLHQAEFLACVPYLYNKVLRGEVYAAGRKIDHDFFMAVRYLNFGIGYDISRTENDLEALGEIKHAPLGGSAVCVVSMESAFQIGMRGLRQDPYYFLKEPPSFVDGEIPCDGVTIERETEAPRYFLAP